MHAKWIKFALNRSLESNLRLHVPASTSSPLSWMYLPLWYPFWWGFTTPFCCSLTSPFCCMLLFSNVSTPPCLSPNPFSWISSEVAVVWVSVTTFNDVFDTLAFSCWGYQDSSLKEAIRENYKSLFILHSIVSDSSKTTISSSIHYIMLDEICSIMPIFWWIRIRHVNAYPTMHVLEIPR